MFELFFRVLSALPLSAVHRLGGLLGRLVGRFSLGYRLRFEQLFGQAGYGADRNLQQRAMAESGKAFLELSHVWIKSAGEIAAQVRLSPASEAVLAGLSQDRGVLFLTPHLGCFEAAARYIAQRRALTVLYRPAKQAALQRMIERGRGQGQIHLAATDAAGVRALFRALRRKEAVGILPDQVPSEGDGRWVPFFGRPAWTMTLPVRLARATGCQIVLGAAARLSGGQGWQLELERVTESWAEDEPSALLAMNLALEAFIRRWPEQYFWAYNRYKAPLHAGMPPEAEAVPPVSLGGGSLKHGGRSVSASGTQNLTPTGEDA